MRREVRERLQELAERERLTPDIVVAEAKNPKSPLHKWGGFTWDIKKAAEERWLQQARQLIRTFTVEIVTTHRHVSTVKYVRDPRAEAKEQGYTDITNGQKDDELAQMLLQRALRAACAQVQKAIDLSAVLGRAETVESILKRVYGMLEKAKEAA